MEIVRTDRAAPTRFPREDADGNGTLEPEELP